MHYRSVADLNETILANLHRLPRDIDLVVGVPRSGLLAANLLSLMANIPLTDLDSLLDGRLYTPGTTKATARTTRPLEEMRRILILDDSISGGTAMARARERVARSGIAAEFIFAAVYATQPHHPEADMVFEQVPLPRIFQWNFMHHVALERACVDIDGVLCLDPTEDQNDDGDRYRQFLGDAIPLHATSRKIGWLVTSRLEKYRDLTEAWLKAQGIEYGELVMLDLPSKAERQRLGAHGSFKAEVYRRTDSTLFIESEERQAEAIARLSGKPVLCIETNHMHIPDDLSPAVLQRRLRNLPSRMKERRWTARDRAKSTMLSVLGPKGYDRLKGLLGRGPRA